MLSPTNNEAYTALLRAVAGPASNVVDNTVQKLVTAYTNGIPSDIDNAILEANYACTVFSFNPAVLNDLVLVIFGFKPMLQVTTMLLSRLGFIETVRDLPNLSFGHTNPQADPWIHDAIPFRPQSTTTAVDPTPDDSDSYSSVELPDDIGFDVEILIKFSRFLTSNPDLKRFLTSFFNWIRHMARRHQRSLRSAHMCDWMQSYKEVCHHNPVDSAEMKILMDNWDKIVRVLFS